MDRGRTQGKGNRGEEAKRKKRKRKIMKNCLW